MQLVPFGPHFGIYARVIYDDKPMYESVMIHYSRYYSRYPFWNILYMYTEIVVTKVPLFSITQVHVFSIKNNYPCSEACTYSCFRAKPTLFKAYSVSYWKVIVMRTAAIVCVCVCVWVCVCMCVWLWQYHMVITYISCSWIENCVHVYCEYSVGKATIP